MKIGTILLGGGGVLLALSLVVSSGAKKKQKRAKINMAATSLPELMAKTGAGGFAAGALGLPQLSPSVILTHTPVGAAESPVERVRGWIDYVTLFAREPWDDVHSQNAARQRRLLREMAARTPGLETDLAIKSTGLWNILWSAFAGGFFLTEYDTGIPSDERVVELVRILVYAVVADLAHADAASRLDRRFNTLNNFRSPYREKDDEKWIKVRAKGLAESSAFLVEYAFNHQLTTPVDPEIMAWATTTVFGMIATGIVQIGIKVADLFTGGEATKIMAQLTALGGAAKKAMNQAEAGDIGGSAATATGVVNGANKLIASL